MEDSRDLFVINTLGLEFSILEADVRFQINQLNKIYSHLD